MGSTKQLVDSPASKQMIFAVHPKDPVGTFITVGQEFVTDGQEVRPVPEQAADQAPDQAEEIEPAAEPEPSPESAEGSAS